jgi:hypothetical protein
VAESGMPAEEAVDLLRRWKHLGAMIIAARQQWRSDWTPAQRLIEAARERLLLESGRLHELLKRSNELLTPLADPLLTDFGTHRQFAQAREEVYSDWLMWIVGRLKTPEYVFRLFGIDDPNGIALCQRACMTVKREVPVPRAIQFSERGCKSSLKRVKGFWSTWGFA